jgi:hypothetical protein
MVANDFILFNGRTANELDTLIGASESAKKSAYASSSYSQSNAWYANFSSANINNNNKGNTNAVRAVAALEDKVKEGWIAAYKEYCKKKKGSADCSAYRTADAEMDLYRLIDEVYSNTYKPRPSTCFIVSRPTYREVFAANFRDRIVQTWICQRLTPLFEARHRAQGNISHNCRKGFGTSSAIAAVERDVWNITQQYTRDAYICKVDVKSFFTSINVRILWQLLERLIIEEYHDSDKDVLLYLTRLTVLHRPQHDAIRRSPLAMWERLNPSKSLYNRDQDHGTAIGNIINQLAANFLMSHVLADILTLVREHGSALEQFVDDICTISRDKDFCLQLRDTLRRELQRYDLTMHPDKFYLQHVSKGVKFVGQVIKPHRRYISNRTVGGFVDALRRTETLCCAMTQGEVNADLLGSLRHLISALNSYLGFLRGCSSYRLRRRLFQRECKVFWCVCYTRDYDVVKVKNDYNFNLYLLRKEIKEYGMDIHRPRSRSRRGAKSPRFEKAHGQLRCRGGRADRRAAVLMPLQARTA